MEPHEFLAGFAFSIHWLFIASIVVGPFLQPLNVRIIIVFWTLFFLGIIGNAVFGECPLTIWEAFHREQSGQYINFDIGFFCHYVNNWFNTNFLPSEINKLYAFQGFNGILVFCLPKTRKKWLPWLSSFLKIKWRLA